MGHVGGMLGTAADDGLVDRIIIEITLDTSLASNLKKIETRIHWSRKNWHEKIADYLNNNTI